MGPEIPAPAIPKRPRGTKGPYVTKEQAQYGYAPDPIEESCGLCKHFDGKSGCDIVIGLIQPTSISRFFEPSGKPYQDDADDVAESAKECGHLPSDECECEYQEGDAIMPYEYDRAAGIAGSSPGFEPGIAAAPTGTTRAGIAGSRPIAMRQPITEHDEFGDDDMPKANGGIDQKQLVRLLDAIEAKCAEIRQKHLDSPANRALETWKQTYELKERLKEADGYARNLDAEHDVRPYGNLAIQEFQRNYAARQHVRAADAAISYFNKTYRR
jgi:hypothetical protein